MLSHQSLHSAGLEDSNVVKKIERAVFHAPWKTPSQYAAYVNSIQKSLHMKSVNIQKKLQARSLLTQKGCNDQLIAEQQEAQRRRVLDQSYKQQKHIAASVRRAATPSARLHNEITDARLAAERNANQHSRAVSQNDQRDVNGVTLPPSDRHEAENAQQQLRVKVSTREGHYVYDDELGLIDVDEGDSDEDLEAVGTACAGTNSDTSCCDDNTLLRILIDVDDDMKALEYLAQRSATPPDAAHSAERHKNEMRVMPQHCGGNVSAHHSIAVYMSSLRPNGINAITKIECMRRAAIQKSWQEGIENIAANSRRALAASRQQESSAFRNIHVVEDQEAALRVTITSRVLSRWEALKREEGLARRKIERVAKFASRLNEKEDAFTKDEQTQREMLDKLAHKMLQRVMHDGKSDIDVLVDNTEDAWGGSRRVSTTTRRVSTAVRASIVLQNFYSEQKLRRKSQALTASPSTGGLGEQSREQPLLSPGSSVALSLGSKQHDGAAHKTGGRPLPLASGSQRRSVALKSPFTFGLSPLDASIDMSTPADDPMSAAALHAGRPSSQQSRERLKSIAISFGASEEDSEFQVTSTSKNTSGKEQTKAAQIGASKEERWRRDAQSISNKLKHELLHRRRPDFSEAYEQKTSVTQGVNQELHQSRVGQSVCQEYESVVTPQQRLLTVGGSPATAVGSLELSNFTAFSNEPSLQAQPNSSVLGSAVCAAPPNAVISANLFHLNEQPPSDTTDAEADDENPVAAALRIHQRRVEQLNDERVAYYQQASNPHSLSSAVDRLVGGRVRRPTVFRTIADVAATSKSSQVLPSGAALVSAHPQNEDGATYFVPQEPEHTVRSNKALADSVHRLVELDVSESGTTSEVALLRRESQARLKHLEESDMKCAAFSLLVLDDDGGSPHSPQLQRRHSSFFQMKNSTSSCAPGDSDDPLPSISSSAKSKNSRSSKSLDVVRKRSNVASLVINSGLGRHDVAETRKDADGDTALFSRSRTRSLSQLKKEDATARSKSPIIDSSAPQSPVVMNRSVASEPSNVLGATSSKHDSAASPPGARSRGIVFLDDDDGADTCGSSADEFELTDEPSSSAAQFVGGSAVDEPTEKHCSENHVCHVTPPLGTMVAQQSSARCLPLPAPSTLRRASMLLKSKTLRVSSASTRSSDEWVLLPEDFS